MRTAAHAALLATALALLAGAAAVAAAAAAGRGGSRVQTDGDVVILTDENFDQQTSSGVWMVDIFAPWCSHCQQLEPTWHAYASEMKAHGVKVAKVDGTRNKVLLKRFAVTGYPTIYLLRGGSTWVYDGHRSVKEMREFALSGYKRETPLPFHKAPNSLLGRAIGLLHSFPSLASRGYAFLKEERGLSDAAIISGLLLAPLAAGAVFICALDALYTRRQAASFYDEHVHYE